MNSSLQQLDELGFMVLPDLIPADVVSAINGQVDQLFEAEGDSAGAEFKQEDGCRRLANLVNKGDIFGDVVAHPTVLEYVTHVLKSVKLSSLNVRSVNPNGESRQPLHADMGAVADDQGYWVCNALWMLHDITLENGPLRVVPGTHRLGSLPGDVLPDPTEHHADEVLVTGSAGTVVVMNAHLWHGGMENRSDCPRRAMHAFYCRRDKPQQQYQKDLLNADVQARLSPELRELLAIDDAQNDQLSRDVAITSGFMK